MSRSPRLVAVVVSSALVVAASGPSSAVAAEHDDPDGLEGNAARQAEVGAELALLDQSDVELSVRVSQLDVEVARLQSMVELTLASQEVAQREVAVLRVAVDEAAAEAAAQQDLAAERAVAAYMHPYRDSVTTLLRANDYDDLHRGRTMIRQVARHDQEVLAERRQAEEGLADQRRLADAAQVRADRARLAAEAALEPLADALGDLEQARAALAVRIDEFETEADALAAEQSRLESIIADRAAAVAPPEAGPGGGSGSPPPTEPGIDPGGGNGGGDTASLVWPVTGVVTSEFGWRWGRMHHGIDIAAPSGSPIGSAAAGEVYFAGWMNGYGYTTLVDNGGGLTTLYAHQSQLGAGVGQQVSRGQVIGYVGSTGNSSGPHLHFEIRFGGTAVDPRQYLP